MIDLSTKTFSTLLESMLLRVTTEINKREGSLIRTSLSAAAWAIEGIYLELQYIQKQAYAETATDVYLDYLVAERGISRKASTAAQRIGTFNTSVDIGTRFGTKNQSPQIVFTVTADNGKDDAGNYTYVLTCETLGSEGNSYYGDLLAIDFVEGLTTATLTDVYVAGVDEETDDSVRERYFDTFGTQPFGGNIAAYRKNILEIEGVGAVQVYPTWLAQAGKVRCFIVTDQFLPPEAGLVEKVQNIICPPDVNNPSQPSANGYGLAPIGAEVTIDGATKENINIKASIVLESGYTVAMIQETADAAIKSYIEECAKQWGVVRFANYQQPYEVSIYAARVISALMAIDGVLNVYSVSINGYFDQEYRIRQGYEDGSVVPVFNSLTLTAEAV